MSIGDVTLSNADAEAAKQALASQYTSSSTPTAVVTVVLYQTLSVGMDIAADSTGGSGAATADQSLCPPLLAELQLDTFAFDTNATCVAVRAGDAYTFALKYPLGADPAAVNSLTGQAKDRLGQAAFPDDYAARVPSPSPSRLRRLAAARETAGHHRRLITVTGVAAPVAALDAEVVIVVEVLASEPGAFASLMDASAAASAAASSVDAAAISATLSAAVP